MSDPREQIANALAGFLTPEQAKILIDEVLAITKKGRAEFSCRKCGARQIQFADIADAKSVTSAITDLMNQSYGRPTEASQQNVEPIQLIRLTSMDELAGYQDGASQPSTAPKRNTKVNKGKVARPAGASPRRKAVDKPLQ